MSAADRQSFLNAIRAAPADDAPRLLYADWLDDRGEAEHAEFIRGQIALTSMETGDDGHTQLEIRCRELLRLHGEEWLGDLARFVGVEQLEDPAWPVFRRGMPERITVSGGTFLDHSERLLRGTVTGVRLTPGGRSTQRLFFVHGWDRVTAAGFVGHRDLLASEPEPWWWREEYTGEPWRSPTHYFTENARLDGLKELRLDFELPENSDWAAALAAARFGPRLVSLTATSGGAPPGLDRLPALRSLELTSGGEGYEFAGRNAAPWAPHLTHLRLNGFGLEWGGGDGIARMPNLRSFELSDGRVTDWLEPGVGTTFWTHAAFTRDTVGVNDLYPLLTAGPLLMLRSLDLSGSRLFSTGPVAVARCPAAETLRVAKLNDTYVQHAEVADALAAAKLTGLERLELGGHDGVRPASASFRRLLERDQFGSLVAVRFAHAQEVADVISETAAATRIADLRIDGRLSRGSAKLLAESKNLDGLRLLDVTTDDAATVAVLRQRWGKRVRVHP